MTLYCEKCGLCHQFTGGEVERMVYALQGMECHAGQQPEEQIQDPDDDFRCLEEVLYLVACGPGVRGHAKEPAGRHRRGDGCHF